MTSAPRLARGHHRPFSIGLGVAALAALPVGSCLATALTFAWARVESLLALAVFWLLAASLVLASLAC